jgi:hypothetical protein
LSKIQTIETQTSYFVQDDRYKTTVSIVPDVYEKYFATKSSLPQGSDYRYLS